MKDCIIGGREVPAELIGPLTECTCGLEQEAEWRRRLAEDGYVFLREALPPGDVLAARAEVFGRLQAVDEIESPHEEGIATGRSRRRETAGDLGAFWRSVSEGPALRAVTHGPALRGVMSTLLDESSRAHDMLYLRPAAVGMSTRPHYDFPFFAGSSQTIYTSWIPLGDIPVTDGPLVVVEGSHHFADLIEPIRNVDYAADRSDDVVQRAAYESQNASDPVSIARARGSRLLTADFQAGDLMVFTGFMMHGSLENHSPRGRVRLSVDVRHQPAGDPADDDRYFGPNPRGSKGGGYGDMKGAKPLTESW